MKRREFIAGLGSAAALRLPGISASKVRRKLPVQKPLKSPRDIIALAESEFCSYALTNEVR